MYMGSHSRAPAVLLQVYEYRYNVEFSDTYASVSYTNHNFQTFSQADSCANCTLQDVFVGINRYHRFFFLFNQYQGSDGAIALWERTGAMRGYSTHLGGAGWEW